VTWHVNVEGSERVFDAVARSGVPVLVHASSVGAYAPGPSTEAVSEDWPTTGIPTSFYSRHKAAVERRLDAFEELHDEVRVVRLRPGLCFKGDAATGIRRLFLGPFVPNRLLRREWLRLLPWPRGLRTQAVHSDDAGEAYRLAIVHGVRGAFNVAAAPVLDADSVSRALDARAAELPVAPVRLAAALSWRLRLQPSPPGWLDLGVQTPIMDVSRARSELGWSPKVAADQALLELVDGLRRNGETPTPPLSSATSGPLRVGELRTGVGARDRV
jgi:nucleoside-diphosphate-sugar epimerase